MKRLITMLAAALAVLPLAACGFTPLYAMNGVSPDLAAIDVQVPHGRTAFLLGEALDDAFARDRDHPARYRLEVALTERDYARGLNLANTAKFFEDTFTVHYKLVQVGGDGHVLKEGVQQVEVTYPAADQPYAGVAGQEDAQKRAASQAAERIRIDLAGYFASKSAL
jgi:LPS-assembly lipoprotein